MSIIRKTGSITALLACLSYGSVNAVHAAQLDFQDPFQEGTPAQPVQAEVDEDLCVEDPAPEAELNSHSNHPNLVASSGISDAPLGLEGKTLIAQGPICDLGGVAPEGAGALGGGVPLAAILGPLGAGAVGGVVAATTGGDGDDDPAEIPEPAELATASLFASLGVAGVLLRRKRQSEKED